jgi:hypothetical protein
MKKILLTGLLFLGLNANSQIVNGTAAKNFTLVDINGNTQDLYTYLDAGKTVFIDVSATWCGPCWDYHNTNALEDLWINHGPAGGTNVSQTTTDDVVVLFVEGETSNTLAQLQGTTTAQTYAGFTQGDWITGVSHPIIDLSSNDKASFRANFPYTGFPTIIKICPNRLMEDVGQASATALYSAKTDCPAPATSSVDVLYNAFLSAPVNCPGESYTPVVSFMNNSTTPLTSATISVKSGATVVATGTYSGSLEKYGIATVTCSPIVNFAGGNLVINIDASGDVNTVNNIITKNIPLSTSNVPANNVIVKVSTDRYGSETTWAIKSINGVTKISGGPYTDQTSAGTYAQTNKTANLLNGCYYLEVKDSYGDGFTGSAGNGSVAITVNGVTYAGVTSFTSTSATVGFVVNNALSAGIDELATSMDLNVYPNPASDKLNVAFNADNVDYTINISDLAGRIVSSTSYSKLADYQNLEIPLTGISSGNYIISISSINGNVNQHIVVE